METKNPFFGQSRTAYHKPKTTLDIVVKVLDIALKISFAVLPLRNAVIQKSCGHCNNFGYKCVVKIENADNKVDGEMAEYPRKEPESGVCMWSKKCDNAQCVLRYNSKSSRWGNSFDTIIKQSCLLQKLTRKGP